MNQLLSGILDEKGHDVLQIDAADAVDDRASAAPASRQTAARNLSPRRLRDENLVNDRIWSASFVALPGASTSAPSQSSCKSVRRRSQ